MGDAECQGAPPPPASPLQGRGSDPAEASPGWQPLSHPLNGSEHLVSNIPHSGDDRERAEGKGERLSLALSPELPLTLPGGLCRLEPRPIVPCGLCGDRATCGRVSEPTGMLPKPLFLPPILLSLPCRPQGLFLPQAGPQMLCWPPAPDPFNPSYLIPNSFMSGTEEVTQELSH